MKSRLFSLGSFIVAVLSLGSLQAAPDPNYHIFLLFGQSNMTGGGATNPVVAKECDTTSRVKVMAYMNCGGSSPECKFPLGRTADKWYTAFPARFGPVQHYHRAHPMRVGGGGLERIPSQRAERGHRASLGQERL
jgi:hypothetical protein